jgi:hypothetical protein
MTQLGRDRATWTTLLVAGGVEGAWLALLAWLAWRG